MLVGKFRKKLADFRDTIISPEQFRQIAMKIFQLLALLVPLSLASQEQKTKRYLLITDKELRFYAHTDNGRAYISENIRNLPGHQYIDATEEEYKTNCNTTTNDDGEKLQWILIIPSDETPTE